MYRKNNDKNKKTYPFPLSTLVTIFVAAEKLLSL